MYCRVSSSSRFSCLSVSPSRCRGHNILGNPTDLLSTPPPPNIMVGETLKCRDFFKVALYLKYDNKRFLNRQGKKKEFVDVKEKRSTSAACGSASLRETISPLSLIQQPTLFSFCSSQEEKRQQQEPWELANVHMLMKQREPLMRPGLAEGIVIRLKC